MSEWKIKLLSEVVKFNPENIGKNYSYEKIYYLDITAVGTGLVEYNKEILLSEAPSRAKRLVNEKDTIIATVRPVNKSYYYFNELPKNTVVSTGFAVIRPIEGLIDSRFLYYVISNNSFTSFLVANEQGANYPAVTPDIIGRAEISLPSLPTQKRIASILSAYDDLIENNLKRIKLLEELAQRTYEEWFVKFIINGEKLEVAENGLPKEWERKTLGELVGYEIGGGWGEEEISNEFDTPGYVIRGTDFNNLTNGTINNVPLRFHKKSNMASRKIEDGDILFEVSGGSSFEGVAKTSLITKELLSQFDSDVMCASFCKLVRPSKELYSKFLFLTFRFFRKVKTTEIWEIRSASNIVNYNWTAFLKYQIVKLPTDKTLEDFNNLINPIYSEIYLLSNQNRLLKESRDILLPRLMSRKIVVGEAVKTQNESLKMVAEAREEYSKR